MRNYCPICDQKFESPRLKETWGKPIDVCPFCGSDSWAPVVKDFQKRGDPLLESYYYYLTLIYQLSVPIRIDIEKGKVTRIYDEETEKVIFFYKTAIIGRKNHLAKEQP